MSRADEIRKRAARFTSAAARTSPPTDEQPAETRPRHQATTRRRRPPRTEPVRSTVDLDPALHHELSEWAEEAAWELGRKRITRQAILAKLAARLIADEALTQQIKDDLASDRDD